ncbi:MAG: M20 family metallo-hydrolase [Treponema sp.]|nr:M20 family metallo-hydrolase [Treponema sp.]
MNDITSLFSYAENSSSLMVELETLLTSNPALAPENGGDGELKKAQALNDWLLKQGIKSEQIQFFYAEDNRVSSGKRPNILVTIAGESKQSVVVMTHLDVVPVGDLKLWNSDPWKVVQDGDKLIGRGVEDNQQGLCSSVLAALSYVKNGVKPQKTIKLLFVADEEVGSKYGAIWLLEHTHIFKKEDLFLIPDGGDPKGETLEIAEKNIIWLKVNVKGAQCHGSRPDQGKNACLAACELSLKLHDLEKIFNKKDSLFEPDYSTFQPTMRLSNVEGINIIPGEDTFCMDCRILPCYSIKEVLAKVGECNSEIENKYGVKVTYELAQQSESPATPCDAPVVQKLASAIKKVHGIEPRTIGIGGGTVGAELRRLGFDCVVWSTMDETAHMPNEYCYISNIIKDAKTLIQLFNES